MESTLKYVSEDSELDDNSGSNQGLNVWSCEMSGSKRLGINIEANLQGVQNEKEDEKFLKTFHASLDDGSMDVDNEDQPQEILQKTAGPMILLEKGNDMEVNKPDEKYPCSSIENVNTEIQDMSKCNENVLTQNEQSPEMDLSQPGPSGINTRSEMTSRKRKTDSIAFEPNQQIECSVREHLEQFSPLLFQGLINLDRERPADPIQHLADWILDNKEGFYSGLFKEFPSDLDSIL